MQTLTLQLKEGMPNFSQIWPFSRMSVPTKTKPILNHLTKIPSLLNCSAFTHSCDVISLISSVIFPSLENLNFQYKNQAVGEVGAEEKSPFGPFFIHHKGIKTTFPLLQVIFKLILNAQFANLTFHLFCCAVLLLSKTVQYKDSSSLPGN